MASWQLTKMLSVHLESPCRHCKRQNSGILLSSTVSHSGCLPRFPLKSVPELLQDLDMQTRIHLWLMHYSAPPHFLLALWEFLNGVFPQQRIGWWGPTCSPDFSPLHFNLQRHLKSTVCGTAVSNGQDLYEWTQNGLEMILVWHLEFSSKSGNHCSHVQYPALKLKVDTWSISLIARRM